MPGNANDAKKNTTLCHTISCEAAVRAVRTAIDGKRAVLLAVGVAPDGLRGRRLAVTEEASTRLSLLASAIEAAVDSARTEQARVDALQAEWDAQLRRERQLAAEIAAELEGLAGSGRGERGSVSAGVR